jgi:hypothetical protein
LQASRGFAGSVLRDNHRGERKEKPRFYHEKVENISDQSQGEGFAWLAIVELAHARENES